MKQSNKSNWMLLLLVVAIILTPLVFMKDSEFEGVDGQAEDIIGEINPEYEPWVESFWEPPSGEIESLLFSLQVAIGAGVIGFVLGSFREKKNALNR